MWALRVFLSLFIFDAKVTVVHVSKDMSRRVSRSKMSALVNKEGELVVAGHLKDVVEGFVVDSKNRRKMNG